jgi:hypothetical protein
MFAISRRSMLALSLTAAAASRTVFATLGLYLPLRSGFIHLPLKRHSTSLYAYRAVKTCRKRLHCPDKSRDTTCFV